MSLRRIALAVVFALSAASCGSTGAWSYPPNATPLHRSASTHPQKVAVVMGSDTRPAENSNMFGMYLVPLNPWGWIEYERPEAAEQFNSVRDYEMDMSRDPALAVAEEFKRSRLFPNAHFSYGGDLDGEWVCEVTPRRFAYTGRLYGYGLSVFGPLLWFLGLPAGRNQTDIEFDLALRDAAGREVWSGTLAETEVVNNSLYYNLGDDVKGFALSFERGMQKLLPEIEAAVAG